jgi:arsenite methyltransferase
MDKEELRKVTEQLAHPSGDLGSDISEKMNNTNEFITARTIEALAPSAGDFIVEIGPGNGALSSDLISRIGPGGRYLGIEISKDMAQIAEKNLRDKGQAKIDVHFGDCYDALVDDASIDGLMAVNVLYFIDDLNQLLAHVRPWFKPNGRCVFGIRPARTLESLRFHEFGHHIRSPEEIESALLAHGFGEISIKNYDEGEGFLGDISFPNGSIIIRAFACA